MLSKILGVIWIILGLLWVIRPDILKRRLQKKMNRRMRRIVFVFIIMFGFLLIGSVLKAPGLIAKIVGIAGMVVAIKGIVLLTNRTNEKVFQWWSERPIVYFRIWGGFVLATGVLLMLVK